MPNTKTQWQQEVEETTSAYGPDCQHLGGTCNWRAVLCFEVHDIVLLEVQPSRQLDPLLSHQRRKSFEDFGRHSLAASSCGYHGIVKARLSAVLISRRTRTLICWRVVIVLGIVNGVVRSGRFDGVRSFYLVSRCRLLTSQRAVFLLTAVNNRMIHYLSDTWKSLLQTYLDNHHQR